MNLQGDILVMITEEDLNFLKTTQLEIMQQLKELQNKGPGGIAIKNITANEFMAAVRISRTKFDQLVSSSKIRIIKKRRKIYIPASEVDRYFNDPGIQ